MFTGIIQEVGTVRAVHEGADSRLLTLSVGSLHGHVHVGDSVAVDGVCLTASHLDGAAVDFDVSAETLRLTTLGELRTGQQVNLEPALRVGDRLGGHFVSGHVDGTGSIRSKEDLPGETRLTVAADTAIIAALIMKGSVAVDGTSLTIAALHPDRFEVSLIPHTMNVTTIGAKPIGRKVNIECDMIGRWVARLLGGGAAGRNGLTVDDLEAQGF
jgi:riboflavin synthase